METRW